MRSLRALSSCPPPLTPPRHAQGRVGEGEQAVQAVWPSSVNIARESHMPKIDIASLQVDTTKPYPAPFRDVLTGRERQRLGNAVGLSQFGVNLTRLKPGAW